MKKTTLFLSILLVAISFTACSSDDDSSNPSFSIDGIGFELVPGGELTLLEQHNIWNDNTSRASFGVNGINGQMIGSASFDLFRNEGVDIAGTYSILEGLDDNTSIQEYLTTHDRVCAGWTTMVAIFESLDVSLSANNPSNSYTVTIVDNGNDNYSVSFNGNFREYNSDFEVVGNVPVHVNITADAILE